MLSTAVREKYRVVIGLEVHAQLLTESKMYVADSTEYGNMPNMHISPITLGHPGTLPKVNRKAIEYAIKMGLACQSTISRYQIFDRKNYFYPDLPKGYQITQDKTPICVGGFVNIKTEAGEKRIGLTRIHMEEDAGKSIHMAEETDTLIDLNRAGVPLIELVTEPEVDSSDEAYALLTEIRRLVRYLEICDGNMEEGSLRCDANISVMLKDAKEFGKKVEVKNMNSFRNVQRAIDYEIERQILAIENGARIVSETRTFDAVTGTTAGMRTKEDLNDYRYFPEPDLSPVFVSDEWFDAAKSSMPPLPWELQHRFVNEFQLPEYDANVLSDSKEIALFFDELCKHTNNYKAASNWVMGPVKSYLNELSLHMDQFPVTPASLAQLIQLIDDGKVNFSVASQRVYPEMLKSNAELPLQIATRLNLIQESDESSIRPAIDEVLSAFPAKVEEYKNGKKGLLGLFMGEVMKRTKGKADPKVATRILQEILDGN
jgi:aspartyl-tRNA(Asn)/glutamyl-tRNA(Gln) amidotransferase subunit B